MKVEYSKTFIKSVQRLSGKLLQSVKNTIQEVIDAEKVEDLTDCKKLTGYNSVYRIRIGNYRAFFILHIQIEDNVVKFEYLLPRGEAYNKKNEENLRAKDV